jgi:4-hydroxy-2-oxoheptanedioate aldolase
VRASIYAGEGYAQRANDELIVMPMIETLEALENLDEILTTPGVDAAYVGPADLSLALGKEPGLDRTDPDVVKAQKTIAAACKRHGVVAGIHVGSPEYALKMIEDGYRFVTLASDSRMLAQKAAEDVAGVRQTASGGVVPAY